MKLLCISIRGKIIKIGNNDVLDCLSIVCRLFADRLPIVCRLFADGLSMKAP